MMQVERRDEESFGSQARRDEGHWIGGMLVITVD